MPEALLGGLAGDAEPGGDLGPGAPLGSGPGDGGGELAAGLAGGGVSAGDPVQDVQRRAGRQGPGSAALAEGGACPGAGAAERDVAECDLGGQGAVRAAGRVAGVVAADRGRGGAGHEAACVPGRSGTTFPAAPNSTSGPCRNAAAPPSPAGAGTGEASVPAARMPWTVR